MVSPKHLRHLIVQNFVHAVYLRDEKTDNSVRDFSPVTDFFSPNRINDVISRLVAQIAHSNTLWKFTVIGVFTSIPYRNNMFNRESKEFIFALHFNATGRALFAP